MKHNSKLNRSRWLLLTLFTLIVGVSPAWGETLTETFDDITVTSRYVLSNGWVMVHNGGNYQGFGGSYDYQLKSGNYDGNTGTSLYCSYSDTNEYVVIPTKLSGTFTYYAKRAESSNGTITFYEATEEGGVFTVTNTQLATTSTTSSWGSQKSFELGDEGKYVAFQLIRSRIDQISATIYEAASGPAFVVKDGSTKLSSPYAFNFGLATAGTTKTFTLSNPGTAAVEGLSVSETGSFGATLSATSIAAGDEATLTITMPSTTGSSAITISSTTEGIDDFIINASGTVRDPNKVYETLGSGSIPEDWSQTSWSFTTGYAYTSSWYQSSNARLITPKLDIKSGEKIMFEAIGTYPSTPSYQTMVVEYSSDKSTWTASEKAITLTSDWQTVEIDDIPVGSYYIAIHASQARVRNYYGGEAPAGAMFAINTDGTSQSLGVAAIDGKLEKTFTITNSGNADLVISVAKSGDAYAQKTLLFSNDKGWSNVYLYAWNDGGALTPAFPGNKQDATGGTNEFGQPLYSLIVP